LGMVKILKLFKRGEGFQVVGGRVISGVIKQGLKCRMMRGEKEIGQGVIAQIQQNKVNVSEVKENQECGLLVNSLAQGVVIAEDDLLEAFEEQITQKTLS